MLDMRNEETFWSN